MTISHRFEQAIPAPGSVPGSAPIPAQTPVHEAEALTHGGTTAAITLNGQIYTLRITRAGKLILTK
ncbi:hemin uptake protein HemP [Pontitalea aquivivens]|uniref:hemin uptake protein HemP n=1 Tax=Pontitalea aquivivens TaxID=3388663 RepID=UPI0039709F07